MLSKPKRVKNKKLLNSFHERQCCICGSTVGVVGHHVRTKGAHGDDIEENLLALCGAHHLEVHSQGTKTFRKKYGLE